MELFRNGESVGKLSAPDHFFYFEVKNEGESTLVAKAGEYSDEAVIRKVDKMNEDYVLKEVGAVLNWFDAVEKEGRFSLNDKFSDIMSTLGGKLWMLRVGLTIKRKMNKSKKGEKKGEKKKSGGFEISGDMLQMLGGFTVLRMTSMIGMVNISFTKEELLKMNRQLNRIRKPKKKK